MPQVCNCLNTLYSDRIKTSHICQENSGLRQPREHNECSLDSLSDLRLLSMLCNDEAKRIEAAVKPVIHKTQENAGLHQPRDPIEWIPMASLDSPMTVCAP